MKKISFFLLFVVLFSACKEKARFSVHGVIGNHKPDYIYISRLDVDTPVFLDSAKISKSGKFSFRIKATEPDFYQLGFSGTDFITLLARPGDKISLAFNGNTLFGNYSVKGSAESEKIRMLDSDLASTKRKLDSLSILYDAASRNPADEASRTGLENQFTGILKEQRKKNISFIINNINSLVAIKALYQRIDPNTYVLYDPKDLQYMKIVNDSLTKYYPNSKHVQALSRDFSKEMNQMMVSKLEQMSKDMPVTKLDPDLKTIEGKRVALSSLKGKYVLLTFWSIESRECISENLELKDYYNQYHKQGFEIYQINLDQNEAGWRAAVKFDELPWISTREDDTAQLLNARLFNVKAVPANYLFDREGRIIASNLHGRSLKIKLDQLFK
jgi:peroxiredoxin